VSVENKKCGIPRIVDLQNAQVATRFLSIEPLLEDLGDLNLAGINWAIVGGESGHGARPMKKEWVTSLRDQCKNAGVAFFFKQWGGVRKSAAGRMLDGKTYDEVPQRVQHLVPDAEERLALIAKFENGIAQSKLIEIAKINSSRLEPAVF
jgi:protein gp37